MKEKILSLLKILFSNKLFILVLIAISLYNTYMLHKINNQFDFAGVYDTLNTTNDKLDGLSKQIDKLELKFDNTNTNSSITDYHSLYPNLYQNR